MRMRALRLQKRDLELVRTVFLHRIVRRDDFLKLGFFTSVARCNQRLSELVQADWLRRVKGLNGVTSHQSLYAAGRVAASHLRLALDLPIEEVNRHCRANEGPLLVEHALRVLDFRVLLHQEAETRRLHLEEWLCEPECLHEFHTSSAPSGPWEKVVIKPDAFFRICGRAHFLEADLGNVSLPRFEQKLIRYRKYAQCGAFTEGYGMDGFTVLTVTVGERRLGHIAELKCLGFEHLITTWPRIEQSGVFDSRCNTSSGGCVSLAAALQMAA